MVKGRGQGGFRGRGNRCRYRDTHDRQQGIMVNQPPQENNNQTDDWDPSQIVCYTCGGTGHYQNGCAFRGHGQNPNYRGSGQGGILLDPRYSNGPYYIRKKWKKKIFTRRKGHEQSTGSQDNDGGCSVNQPPDTCCESADNQNETTPETKEIEIYFETK